MIRCFRKNAQKPEPFFLLPGQSLFARHSPYPN